MKKALFISYYFPPIGLAGSLRDVKFTRYPGDSGRDVVVLTSKGVRHVYQDESLPGDLPEDLKVFSLDHDFILPLLGKSRLDFAGNEDRKRLLSRMESFFLIPDSRALWFYPALIEAVKIAKSQAISLIFSTSPPLTSHLIAVFAGKLTKKPVVLDYRDAWYEDPFGIIPTQTHKRIIKEVERFVVQRAKRVIAVNEGIASGRIRVGAKNPQVIRHGYDPYEFPSVKDFPDESKLIFTYAGSITYVTNPAPLFEAFKLLFQTFPEVSGEIEVRIYSVPPGGYRERFSESIFRWEGFVPRRDIPDRLFSSHVLVATIDKERRFPYISTSKIYDYIGSGRPILGVVPRETDAWKVIGSLGNSFLVTPDNQKAILDKILEIYKLWKTGGLKLLDERMRQKYNVKNLTAQLAKIFDEVIG